MERLDKLIKWYEDNASNKYEKMICEELKVINHMFDKLEDDDEQLFVDKIIPTFCEIVENHTVCLYGKWLSVCTQYQ